MTRTETTGTPFPDIWKFNLSLIVNVIYIKNIRLLNTSVAPSFDKTPNEIWLHWSVKEREDILINR